jgi:surface-anchored protein
VKLGTRLLGLTAAATVCVVMFAASPAAAATIETGHIDVIDVDYNSLTNSVTLDIKTHTPDNDDLSPVGTTIRIIPESTITIPSGAAWSCLGPAGSTIYVGPQSNFANRLFAGWDTNDVPAAQGPVKVELVSWTFVPPPGPPPPVPPVPRFALYTTAGLPAVPTFLLNTNTATGCPVSVWSIGALVHGHGNWAFSTAGTYTLTFKATLQNGAGVNSGNVVYTFQAG